QQRELGLALAVLDEAQLGSGDADLGTQLIERVPPCETVMADAVAEGRQVDAGAAHSLIIAKEARFLTPAAPEKIPSCPSELVHTPTLQGSRHGHRRDLHPPRSRCPRSAQPGRGPGL